MKVSDLKNVVFCKVRLVVELPGEESSQELFKGFFKEIPQLYLDKTIFSIDPGRGGAYLEIELMN